MVFAMIGISLNRYGSHAPSACRLEHLANEMVEVGAQRRVRVPPGVSEQRHLRFGNLLPSILRHGELRAIQPFACRVQSPLPR